MSSLKSAPAFELSKTYPFRLTDSSYLVTIGSKIIRETPLKEKEDFNFVPWVTAEGWLRIDFVSPNASSDEGCVIPVGPSGSSFSCSVRVPASFARAISLGDTSVEWALYHHDEEGYTIRGHVDHQIETVVVDDGEMIAFEPLDWQRQTVVNGEELSSPQEQFRRHLSPDVMAQLGWEPNERVSLTVKRRGSQLCLVVEPDDESASGVDKKVAPTTKGGSDGLLYLPTAIVRSLGYVEEPLTWIADDNRLIGSMSRRR